MDVKDMKGFLYGWLGKQKLGTPSYQTTPILRGGIQRFKCELRVPGQAYTGLGNSQNKKDAATNAAMDFCNFLVRQGLMQSKDVPALSVGSLESTSYAIENWNGNNSTIRDCGSTTVDATVSTFNARECGFNTEVNISVPSTPQFALNDSYIAQKAEEVAQSESVDMKAELHGGWTVDNSKMAINEFMQKLKQPAVNYVSQLQEANSCRSFVTTASVFIPQIRTSITAQGQGSNKKVAESMCGMSLVRQLFHMGIMAPYDGQRKKTTSANLPEIPLSIDGSLSDRISAYLKSVGVVPAVIDAGQSTSESPASLIIDCKLVQYEEQEVIPVCNVSWAPPMQNWNPWRSTNIDEPPLAFMSLADISNLVSEKERSKEIEPHILGVRSNLPVFQFRDEIVNTIRENSVTLIKGETGCGKSTQVVQYLLESYEAAGRGAEFNAIVSQPRRISAISLADRVASERGETVGESVGYCIRFEGVAPRPYGAIMFCTVGVLLRKMESGLKGISHVFIDEIHERDINTDFVLIVLREMLRDYPNLRVVLMSATIDTQMFTNYFGGCPIIEMTGRTHPVKEFFLEQIVHALKYMPPQEISRKDESDFVDDEKSRNLNLLSDDAAPLLRTAMSRISENVIHHGVIEAILLDIESRGEPGSILMFLPGWNEIMQLMNFLNEHSTFSNVSKYVILPLHSSLTGSEQRKVFQHYGPARKIILSTNIAETSVTIDDVVFVIDSCKAKERMYTSNNNMVHFATVWASRTNMAQRSGRAGRVRPGVAYRLCSLARFDSLEEHRTAEMLRSPLHETALTVKLLRLGGIGEFLSKAIQPPPCDVVIESVAMLQNMGALDRNLELTDLGHILARLPIEPVIGKTIILGTALGIGSLMCQLAASSSFSSAFVPRERSHTRLNHQQRSMAGARFSDHIAAIVTAQEFRDANEQQSESMLCQRVSFSYPILKMASGAANQLADVLCSQSGFSELSFAPIRVDPMGDDSNLDLMTSLLVSAFYPNICYYRGKRKVYTLEQATALVSKTSVLTPLKGDVINVPSPLIVFTEKLRTHCISCKELTVVSIVQLLLFGCRRIECIGDSLIRLDDLITVRMSVEVAAAIVAIRPCIEALIVTVCKNPGYTVALSDEERVLCGLLRELSSPRLFAEPAPEKDYLLTEQAAQQLQPAPVSRGYQVRGRGFSRGMFTPRGAGSHNGFGFGFGNNNNGGGKWPQRGHRGGSSVSRERGGF